VRLNAAPAAANYASKCRSNSHVSSSGSETIHFVMCLYATFILTNSWSYKNSIKVSKQMKYFFTHFMPRPQK